MPSQKQDVDRKIELDLFSVPPAQTSMEQGSWVEYHPLTAVRDGGPIEFEMIVLCYVPCMLLFSRVDVTLHGGGGDAGWVQRIWADSGSTAIQRGDWL